MPKVIIEITVKGDQDAALEAIDGCLDAGTIQAAIHDEANNPDARDKPLNVKITDIFSRPG